MSREPAIAFFLPTVRGGGAQRVVVNLIQGLVDRRRPVDLVLATRTGVFLDQIPPEVRIVDLRAGRLIRSLVPLTRYLKRERPRVVVSSMSHANLIALWAARLAGTGTPVVATVHNTMSQSTQGLGRLGGVLEPRLLRAFYPWASSIVAVSEGAADDLARTSGLRRERVSVVYNPVITPEMMAMAARRPDHPWLAPGAPPVILGVGRLTAQKDFPNLIRAFAALRARREARLIILGEGEDRPLLEALIASLGVAHDVSLPGFRPDAMAYMASSALFALSSAWEGLPTVLIEAMAAGARVVSTDCPSGPREILQNGRLGRLVPVGDSGALAEAMERTLAEAALPVPAEALTPYTRDAAVDNYLRLIESAR
ncbi:MAG TPA: glycosyltransferase [Gemmatimonadales bacterium]|nr:glycosyltransferase [Gemmatimonadales bacterium]